MSLVKLAFQDVPEFTMNQHNLWDRLMLKKIKEPRLQALMSGDDYIPFSEHFAEPRLLAKPFYPSKNKMLFDATKALEAIDPTVGERLDMENPKATFDDAMTMGLLVTGKNPKQMRLPPEARIQLAQEFAEQDSQKEDTEKAANLKTVAKLLPWEAMVGSGLGMAAGGTLGALTGQPTPVHFAGGSALGYLLGAPFTFKRLGRTVVPGMEKALLAQKDELTKKLETSPDEFTDQDQRNLDYINNLNFPKTAGFPMSEERKKANWLNKYVGAIPVEMLAGGLAGRFAGIQMDNIPAGYAAGAALGLPFYINRVRKMGDPDHSDALNQLSELRTKRDSGTLTEQDQRNLSALEELEPEFQPKS